MRRFNVKVNGREYVVEIEEDTGAAANAAPAAAVTAAPSAPAPAAGKGSVEVRSPIQGRIVGISASAGDKVSKGGKLCVLEAMKMEYDVMSPADGTVVTASVTKGETAEEGKVLFTIDPSV
ncbi:MAG: acetyl-CoA carboxylase biotin carboxyl carrier protein subunit [Clostridia bacterium]|nr:acetyl-CoA carboxylase biotin carboxyl carrier protein subunit [Clostridia bacterium]